MKIITTGFKFVDIDGFACPIAYGALLDLLNEPNKIVFVGPINHSVTKVLRDYNFEYETSYKPNKNDKFILVDISELDFFPKFVTLKNLIEVWDHRYAFMDFWKRRKDIKVTIEEVGSCATLIFEQFVKYNLIEKIDIKLARLLYTAISGHTLSF